MTYYFTFLHQQVVDFLKQKPFILFYLHKNCLMMFFMSIEKPFYTVDNIHKLTFVN